MDVLETLLGIHGLGEEVAKGKERCNKGTSTLDTLSEIETDFRVTGRLADGKEVVGTGLERGQASSSDEHYYRNLRRMLLLHLARREGSQQRARQDLDTFLGTRICNAVTRFLPVMKVTLKP